MLSERDLSIVDGREKDFEIEEGPRLKLRLNRKALLQANPARLVRHAWMGRVAGQMLAPILKSLPGISFSPC